MIVQHSSATNEHYTPEEIIEAARVTMHGIDLDPASCAIANRRVQAERFYSKDDDGLSKPWNGSVWLNPPGGKVKNKSNAAIWWTKLVDEWKAGRVAQAVFLGFTLEILATSQDAKHWVGYFPFCIPRRRIAFVRKDGSPGESPPHSNVIAFLPPINRPGDLDRAVLAFAKNFQKFGTVNVSNWTP